MSKNFVANKLNIRETKTLSTIALILILTVSAIMVSMPTIKAHTPTWSVPSWSYVSVSPNPIGVNQQALVVFWLDKPPPTAIGAYGDRWTFTVQVTKPDGSKETLGPITSDPVGSGYTTFTPTQVGAYTFVSSFPGKILTGQPAPPPGQLTEGADYINDTIQPSASKPVSLAVQQSPVGSWPEAPLPTGYWTRPINNMNRNWGQISGNWLAGSSVVGRKNDYTKGPESAHVVWVRQLWDGGIAGGQYGDIGYFSGLAYENYWAPPIIMNGRLYYNVLNPPREGWYCVDLQTGKTLYFQNTTMGGLQIARQSALNPANSSGNYPQLAFGQIYDYETPNEHGTFPYLWITVGTTWQMYDAFTGNWICNINNVPSASASATAQDGSLLRYVIGPNNSWVACWNSSLAIIYKPSYFVNEYWLWRPTLGATFDGRNGYSWNKTLSGVPSDAFVLGVDYDSTVLLLTNGLILGPHVGMGAPPPVYTQIGVSLKPETAGQVLWTKQRNAPAGNLTIVYGTAAAGVYTMNTKETMQWYAYSSTTGDQLWGPTLSQDQWDMYGMGGSIAYGKLFAYGYAGKLCAYELTTGNLAWTYNASNIGGEAPYVNFPLSLGCIADGKLYMYSTEHSPSMPLTRGYMLRCVNASNGAELWKIDHWGSGPAIADGYIVDLNLYDNQIYCYGKGQTAITVTVPDTVVPLGTGVLIRGKVTDQSPGAQGTPAISDANMEQWMEYLYMQQSMPTNATGVSVALTAIDPNGNTQNIGTVTSNVNGNFGVMWTPPVPGYYTITAAFAGSKSYFGSSAETSIGVGSAQQATPITTPTIVPPPTASPPPTTSPSPAISPTPTTTPIPPPSSPSVPTTYIVIAVVAIIVVVAAAALALRGRK